MGKPCDVRPDELKRLCLGRPGAVEEFPFTPDVSVFKVAGRMFALSDLGAASLKVSLKCDPELAESLRATYPEITAGYHLNKRHWNTVDLEGSLPTELVTQMLEDSYDLVVAQLPRAKQKELLATE
jgi:predicted DNA-binding protein (MmcQ/YjbR family)